MNRIILQPAGDGDAREHYIDTIVNTVPLTRIRPFVSQEIYNRLLNLYKESSAPVWGVTPGRNESNKNKWQKVQPGDIALFSRKNAIISSATVAFTTHNKELALELWKTNSEGETLEYIYFLDEIANQHIPYLTFNKAAGYKENYIIRGFNVLDEEKSMQIMNLMDLHSEMYFPDISKEEYFRVVSEPDSEMPLDKRIQVKARTEQAFLRNTLFRGKKEEICGICGRVYPISFLVAAHIKKRADCKEKKRRDYQHIIMPMCKFGCDELYEKGYIAVEEGTIIDTNSKYKTPSIEEYVNSVVGKNCSRWSEETSKYFSWHKRLHTE